MVTIRCHLEAYTISTKRLACVMDAQISHLLGWVERGGSRSWDGQRSWSGDRNGGHNTSSVIVFLVVRSVGSLEVVVRVYGLGGLRKRINSVPISLRYVVGRGYVGLCVCVCMYICVCVCVRVCVCVCVCV